MMFLPVEAETAFVFACLQTTVVEVVFVGLELSIFSEELLASLETSGVSLSSSTVVLRVALISSSVNLSLTEVEILFKISVALTTLSVTSVILISIVASVVIKSPSFAATTRLLTTSSTFLFSNATLFSIDFASAFTGSTASTTPKASK